MALASPGVGNSGLPKFAQLVARTSLGPIVLGAGVSGTVYAGKRKNHKVKVAIKHFVKAKVTNMVL